VRNEQEYFDDIPDEKIPKDMLAASIAPGLMPAFAARRQWLAAVATIPRSMTSNCDVARNSRFNAS
jgi:hypothetical protein